MKYTDGEYNALLENALSAVTPDVWEGVYTGEDVDRYITFFYTNTPTMYANDRPTILLRDTTVVLWERVGIDAFEDRQAVQDALAGLGGTFPISAISTDNGWQQFVFRFTHDCEYPFDER